MGMAKQAHHSAPFVTCLLLLLCCSSWQARGEHPYVLTFRKISEGLPEEDLRYTHPGDIRKPLVCKTEVAMQHTNLCTQRHPVLRAGQLGFGSLGDIIEDEGSSSPSLEHRSHSARAHRDSLAAAPGPYAGASQALAFLACILDARLRVRLHADRSSCVVTLHYPTENSWLAYQLGISGMTTCQPRLSRDSDIR